jgi:hypothetical protein
MAKADVSMFEQIKAELDPAFSYMVFEKTTEAREQSAFREVFAVLERMGHGVLEYKLHSDDARGRLLLVVKFGPGRTDSIMQEFLNEGLPKDITFYAYGSHGAG